MPLLPSLKFGFVLAVLPFLFNGTAALAGPQGESAASSTLFEVMVDPATTRAIGQKITLTVEPLQLADGVFSSAYAARVSPFRFFSESGQIRIEAGPEQLAALLAGEPVSFRGEAVNRSQARRRVSGEAIRQGPDGGELRLAIRASGIDLVFHSRFTFAVGERDPAAHPAESELVSLAR
jgi:hypothetical protein